MKLLTALIMLLMMALYFSPFSHAQVMEQGWGQYGHDARHTWRTVHKINITKPAVLSKISADGRGMLLYENYLVVYHLYNVTVLDAETLTKFAEFSVGDYINAIGVYDGAVYVSGDKGLYAYTLNGKLIWKVANVSGKVIQISEDGIFLTNFVKVFRITFSGELKNTWLIGNISAPPAISGDMLYIPTWRLHNGNKLNTSLYVINLTENTTRVISIFGSFEIIENVAVDNDGTVYLYTELSNRSTGAGGIKIYALDKTDNLKWEFYGRSYHILPYNSITVIGNKNLYVLTSYYSLFTVLQLNKANGSLLRKMQFNTTCYTQAFVDASDTLYLVAKSTLYSYSPYGQLNWKLELGKRMGEPRFRTVIVPYSTCIYVMDSEGYIYKIGAACPAPPTLAPLYAGVLVAAIVAGVILMAIWRKKKVIL